MSSRRNSVSRSMAADGKQAREQSVPLLAAQTNFTPIPAIQFLTVRVGGLNRSQVPNKKKSG